MSISQRLIRDDSLRLTPGGFRLGLGLPAIRSVPFACVEDLALEIDGAAIDSRDITFSLETGPRSLNGMHELADVYWYVLDPLEIEVTHPGLDVAKAKHDITATLSLRLPWVLIGEGDILVIQETARKSLQAHEAMA